MAQLFTRRANVLALVCLGGIPLAGAAFLVYAWLFYGSPFLWGQAYAREQPVPFSHEHHAGGLGLDCRFCHATVETAAFAGMPATQVCMSCHSQVWSESAMLKPVRESYATGAPLRWARVYDLPDYVYFHHGAHVAHGVGCSTCHDALDTMPLTRQAQRITMKWCLGCHFDPARYIRAPQAVFAMGWQPRAAGDAANAAWLQHYRIDARRLRDCYVCHR